MPLYGNLATAKAFLRAQSDSVMDADADVRLADIQIAISAALEEKIAIRGALTVTIWPRDSDILILPRPFISVSGVTVGGTVEGGAFSGGTALDATNWVHWFVDEDGLFRALRRGGGWSAAVQVVGVSAGIDPAAVPDDVTAAATLLIAETYKIREASPAGFVGPDGATVPIRNPWDDPTGRVVIKKYAEPAVRLVV